MNNLKAVLILTLLGIVLSSLCYTLPGWMLFENTNSMEDAQFGLWYFRICSKDKVCNTISVRDTIEKSLISDVNHVDDEDEIFVFNLMYTAFVVYQIEMTLSLVSGMIALAVCYKIFKHGQLQNSYSLYRYMRTLYAVGLVANLIAAVLVLLPMGRFANDLWHFYQFHTVLQIKLGFPYALLLGGTGGVCFSISTLVLIFNLIRQHHQGEMISMQLTTQQIPMVIIQTGVVADRAEVGYYPGSEPPPYYPPLNYPGNQLLLTQDQAPMLPQKQQI